ncbi:PRC-barrel domain-containing protein [Elongatibacter sediminis]|uniref:PRC-barrel domain-containing protein n=1 Tax=Elongatibacter sediminis TaxID=3119006 RepID=A0AAW9R4K9_9GAMM
MTEKPDSRRADLKQLADQEVINREGAELGAVDQIMVDVADGRIEYVILTVTDEQNGSDRRVAIPWSQFRLSADRHCLELDISLRILNAVARNRNVLG